MTAALFTLIALPIVAALTLRFTSWAERSVLQDEVPDSNAADASSTPR